VQILTINTYIYIYNVMAIRPVVPVTHDRGMIVEYGGVIIPRKAELL
jgi:hypothetical protein